MRNIRSLLPVVLCVTAVAQNSGLTSAAQVPTYITHVTVIDTKTGNEAQDRTVVISGDRILQVTDSKQVKIPPSAKTFVATAIGMQDFSPEDVFYLGGTESIHPAYLFEISARDLARFGLLYLRHGRWEDKQIIPEDWVQKRTHANEMVQVGGKDAGGYEYLWWVEYGGKHLPEATLPGMYSARGAGGHYVLVIPTLDLVIVHRVDNDAPNKDVKSVIEQGLRPLVNNASFGLW